jgi:hypothetical protein
MEAFKLVWRRLSGLFRRETVEKDMDKEMQFHVDMLAQEYERSGMPQEEARIAARRRFGNVIQLKDRGRDAKGGGMLDELRQDLLYGTRMLRRSPGFSILAILCLTIGIGANAAVYSWIEGVLLRPYALVADQDRPSFPEQPKEPTSPGRISTILERTAR